MPVKESLAIIAIVLGSNGSIAQVSTSDPLAIKVTFALSPKAAAHLAKGNKLVVSLGYRGQPLKAKGRVFEIEEDGLAALGNSKEMIVSSITPISIAPPPTVRTKVTWVKAMLVSVSGWQRNMSSDYRVPFISCDGSTEQPITVAQKTGLRLKCKMSTE